jgi:GGDEF domain-containing protein
MEIFDKVDPKTLDRRHWQLSMLSLGMIVVLGVGMALLMYPAVFGSNATSGGHTTRTLFFGFCTLCVLVVAYLLNRQYVVHQLRKNLVDQKTEMVQLRQEASADLLGTVPGFSHFQDRLIMGFRRATQTGEPLSLVLVRLKPSHMFDSPAEVSVALGDAARVLLRKLRTDDSLYHLSSAAFAMVLPNTGGADMNQVASRVAEGLADASGASNRFTFDLQVVNYPEQASSAYEMERIADTFSLRKGSAAEKADGA